MHKYCARSVWILLAMFFLSAAGADQSPRITVTDDLNRAVSLPAPARRIISLSPHITENLFAAGAGARVVGAMNHSDYPPAAAAIKVVASHARVNLEAVIALAPDLVVAWPTAGLRPALDKIEQFGYPVYYSAPREFTDIIDNIEEFALLAGTRPQVSTETLRAELAAVRAEFSHKSLLKVFYQIWNAPLITLNRDHIISRAFELCGARNVFGSTKIIAPRISVESVLRANPDIIIGGRGASGPADLSMWKKWREMSAVRRDGFIWVDADIMNQPTARMIMGVRGLCEQIDRARD